MEPIKVVVHYTNGEVIKGFTRDFFPNKDLFHLFLATDPTGEAIEVLMKDLKAIFFVRDFTGDPQYNERKIFLEGENSPGRKLEVICIDDELLVGSTLGYDPSRKGFFLFPADPEGNNIRIYSITSTVKKVRYL
ncbi:MAG: hypothetical protein ABSH06_28045 [Thermodesulfobacteriota bacterium]